MIHFSKLKIIFIVAMCALSFAFLAPNFLSREAAERLPTWLPRQQINLGLDLQGGSHLLLEVDVQAVVSERLESLVDSIRTELRKEKIRYDSLGKSGNTVSVVIKDTDRLDAARQILRDVDRSMQLTSGDGGRYTLAFDEVARRDIASSVVDQSLEIIRRRIDETGVREPSIQRQGQDRILVQLPGIDEPERMKDILGKTAKLTFHLVDDQVSTAEALSGRVPPGSELLPSAEESDKQGRARMILVKKRAIITGEMLTNAQPTVDQQQNLPAVSFKFDSVGGKRFGETTAKNVGKQFAIVLDGKVISAPVIREPILGGSGIITGHFTVQTAQDLALLLRAGALPAPLTILEERTVGPGLGADSISDGAMACLIGTISVAFFMIAAYGLFGVFANLAMIVNVVMILALLSVLQATLTLPGIAGIVLTIGMAVDANVLIYERIREEVRGGRTPMSAIDSGFSMAIATIIDANLTTLIAGLLLYVFGSGPVRGFAVTLSIGIVTTMFTAIMVTRLLVVLWYKRARPKVLRV